MRKLLTILAALALGVFVALPARAQAMDTTAMVGCTMMDMSGDSMDMTTIQSLRECVVRAYDRGYITNQGVEAALLKLLDAAQTSADSGKTTAAIKGLDAFIALVQKQPGTIVDPACADCLTMHAALVIQALGG